MTRRQTSLFIQLCLIGTFARLSYSMARSPLLPRFAQDLGASPALIGLILGASTITGILLKFPAGVFSDVVGRRSMLLFSTIFFAIPPFLYMFVRTPEHLLTLRFLHGMATAIFGPVASAYVADLFAQDRGEGMGWFSAVAELGAAIGPVLGGWVLLTSQTNYAVSYLIVGALGFLPLLLLFRLPKETQYAQYDARRWQEFSRGALAVLRHQPILLTSTMEACLFLGVGAVIGWLPLYARLQGINEAQVGLILSLMLVTALVGKPLTGALSDRVGRKPMIIGGLLLCMVILPLLVRATTVRQLAPLVAGFGLGMAVVTPATHALVADLCRSGKYGAALGIFGTIWDIGDASGPIVAGLLISRIGYQGAFTSIAVLLACGAVLFALLVHDPLLNKAASR
ncbi:MAG: MFS transporter [Candidatus Omnitrophica bacterium]|nr:MFS transporter [Candidatus Omnitrophota bacterium]